MKDKKNKLLLCSAFVCFLLVLSISSVATQASVSVGKWSDPLPVVDGQVSVDDQKRSSQIQVSNVNVSNFLGEVIGTCNFSLFMAGNGSHVYAGLNITKVPFIANLLSGPGGNGPPPGSNLTMVNLRFDNDGSGTIDDDEDQKQVLMFNETYFIASDEYWSTDGYDRDVGTGGPNPGNITAYNITHSNPVAQGAFGDIEMEMMFVNGSDPQGRDGGGVINDTTTIALDFFAFTIQDGDNGFPSNYYVASTVNVTFGDDPDASDFDLIDNIGGYSGNLDIDFTFDGDITTSEEGAAEFTKLFSNRDITGPSVFTTDVDVYVANNGTHLYVGVIMDDVPYYANITWSDPNGPPDADIPQNVTFIGIRFDNDNNDIIDANEDLKEVIFGNTTLTVGDDRFWNTTDPMETDYYSDSGSDFPPDPGDMTDFVASHSNTATQGNIGEFTVELVMLLADDINGYDGGGLSGTVGFSVYYQAFVNIVFPSGPGQPSMDAQFYSEFTGMPEDDDDATLFWDLVIKDTNPAPEIDSPDDVSYDEGETGNNITWTATDTNPYKYNVTKDGVVVQSGYWNSSEPLVVLVDGLEVGEYNYTCTVNDTGGNSVSDSVIVTVTEEGEEDEFPWLWIGLGAMLGVVLALLVIFLKKR